MYLLIIILILIISCIIIFYLFSNYFNKFNKEITGSHEKNQEYYHGSSAKINELKPMSSGVLEGESAVFATDNKSTALMFIGKWNDSDISYGSYGEHHFALELYPNTFDKLKKSGYLYTVSSNGFYHDKRLGLQNEFINKNSVKIIKTEKIKNAFNEMKKLKEIEFITFDEMLKRLFSN